MAADNDLGFSIQSWIHITTTKHISDICCSFHFVPLFIPYSLRVTHPRCAQISGCIFAVCRHAQLPCKFKCVVHDGILNKYSIPCRLGTNSACSVSRKYRFSEYNGQDATFLNLFISVRRSTCFMRFFRPSSGAQNCAYSSRYLSDQYFYLLLATRLAAGSSIGLTNT